ncbi:uncharacterized protein LOC113312114 [Papaver somniferum]|uniref:uncharacterized protein LOC113312114 n=1 Tax=Papaver somniferum TaxID=3469 RepID=UPI000E6F9E1E|nr:uncharacterized protein LOC113312114 [Papaver somniferum]
MGNDWFLQWFSCLAETSDFSILNPVFVCNPITKECVRFIKDKEEKEDRKILEILSGFGYCRLKNEYKVVRIRYYGDEMIAAQGGYVAGHLQVYTLGSGGGWRDKGETHHSFIRGSRSVYLNGVCFWLDSTGMIVAFDFASAEFQLISPPPSMDEYNNVYSNKLCTLGGCLCIFQQPLSITGIPGIWVLRKNEVKGKEDIWVKECPLPSIVSWELYRKNTRTAMPFALTKRGEILFKFYSGKTIASYDLKSATPRNNWMLDKVWNRFEAIPHVNTFVSLKALGEEVTKLAPINRF